ncbi:MAG: hypothetical protein FD123_401 [Bacteroidetes bacterium]|nr:MAG: hypothetical protein FD123_401 [Bacteroidota bacterium]
MNASDKKYLCALGKAIRELREAQGISQDQLAYESGLHRTTINRIENGHFDAGALALRAIAKALNVPTTGEIFLFEKKEGK